MGCRSSKILAGSVEQDDQNPTIQRRRSSYAVDQSAPSSSKSYQEDLARKGLGTKKSKSVNKGLVLSEAAESSSKLTDSSERDLHAASVLRSKSHAAADGSSTSTLPLLAMGAGGQRRLLELNAGYVEAGPDIGASASLSDADAASKDRRQQDFEANDFDF